MVMNCTIECNSPGIIHHHQLLPLQKHSHNSCFLYGKSLGYCKLDIHHQQRQCYGNFVTKVLPLNVEVFSTSSLTTLAAVAKPADPMVLLQTSAVLIFFYLLANFVVPQFITKEFDKVEETEKPNITESKDEGKASSSSSKRGFNSTKPK